jgi:hypothetical protein
MRNKFYAPMLEGALWRKRPPTRQEWVTALQTVEESIRRHSGSSGSRAYLDFINFFIPE